MGEAKRVAAARAAGIDVAPYMGLGRRDVVRVCIECRNHEGQPHRITCKYRPDLEETGKYYRPDPAVYVDKVIHLHGFKPAEHAGARVYALPPERKPRSERNPNMTTEGTVAHLYRENLRKKAGPHGEIIWGLRQQNVKLDNAAKRLRRALKGKVRRTAQGLAIKWPGGGALTTKQRRRFIASLQRWSFVHLIQIPARSRSPRVTLRQRKAWTVEMHKRNVAAINRAEKVRQEQLERLKAAGVKVVDLDSTEPEQAARVGARIGRAPGPARLPLLAEFRRAAVHELARHGAAADGHVPSSATGAGDAAAASQAETYALGDHMDPAAIGQPGDTERWVKLETPGTEPEVTES